MLIEIEGLYIFFYHLLIYIYIKKLKLQYLVENMFLVNVIIFVLNVFVCPMFRKLSGKFVDI